MDTASPRIEIEKHLQLRKDFEVCRALVERARARAVRAAEEAIALRTLLKARTQHDVRSASADAWAAAAHALAEMARERDRILGTVAHELRQPLSAALAAERILVERGPEPAASKAAAVLDRQLLHLTKLIEMLLDYSHVAVGSSLPVHERVDLRDVVRETIEAFEPRAHGDDLTLSVSLPEDAQVVEGDPTRLRQLVSNLIQNGVRYTPAGGRVHCAVAPADGAVRLTVSDTGAGIAAADLERIFEPFTRAAADGQGLGLGLALARRIAHLHGGTIAAESDGPGRGATFTVALPLAPPGV